MENKDKFYLPKQATSFKEGHKIVFDMPAFCSGDYEAVIYKDDKGLFILIDDNFFQGCSDFKVVELTDEEKILKADVELIIQKKEAERLIALSKLTDYERKLLGI